MTKEFGPFETACEPNIVQAAKLAHSLVRASKAKATVSKDESYWSHFKDWARSYDLSPLAATPQTVALYWANCSKADGSISGFCAIP